MAHIVARYLILEPLLMLPKAIWFSIKCFYHLFKFIFVTSAEVFNIRKTPKKGTIVENIVKKRKTEFEDNIQKEKDSYKKDRADRKESTEQMKAVIGKRDYYFGKVRPEG